MAEPVAVRLVIAWPSGSLAVTTTVSGEPSATVAVSGALTIGAWSPAAIVICVVAEPVRELLAVKVTLYVPAWPEAGVNVNVPEVLDAFLVNVALVGSGAAARPRITSPSG